MRLVDATHATHAGVVQRDQLIMVINWVNEMWLWRPTEHEPVDPEKRRLGRRPLIDLAKLQAWLAKGDFNPDAAIRIATLRCRTKLQELGWSVERAAEVIGKLRRGDYKHSEWCRTSDMAWYPCDVYVIGYDDLRDERSNKGLEFYFKFSLDDFGGLALIIIQAHPSR